MVYVPYWLIVVSIILYLIIIVCSIIVIKGLKKIDKAHLDGLAKAWSDGYALGINDEQLSQGWTSGQVHPARANPYLEE